MNTRVVVIEGLPSLVLEGGIPCQAAVFRDKYKECRNQAIKKRGKWALCAPHGRLDEVEIVVDNGSPTVI